MPRFNVGWRGYSDVYHEAVEAETSALAKIEFARSRGQNPVLVADQLVAVKIDEK